MVPAAMCMALSWSCFWEGCSPGSAALVLAGFGAGQRSLQSHLLIPLAGCEPCESHRTPLSAQPKHSLCSPPGEHTRVRGSLCFSAYAFVWEWVSSPFTAQKCGKMFKEEKHSLQIKAKLLFIFNHFAPQCPARGWGSRAEPRALGSVCAAGACPQWEGEEGELECHQGRAMWSMNRQSSR